MPAISSSPDPKTQDEAQRALDQRRGRFVPWIIAAFYLTFMSVLIGFVVIAYDHPPNEVTPNAYEKGLAYNNTLTDAAAQAQLGWQSAVDYTAGRVVFQLEDGHHAPADGARVVAWFVHPAQSQGDRTFDLSSEGNGVYSAKAPLPSKGLWTVHITAEKMDKQYQTMTQIEVD